jgi:GNAT superfamily N-acetyltransferase
MAGRSHTESLRDIAYAAKAHWGYDPALVRAWADSFEFPAEERILVEDGGWAAVVPKGEVCWLDDLWVEPAAMGRGLGRRLFERAAELGRELGCTRMEWEAEPNALGFYERMGASYVRDSDVTEWGRVLPVMGVSLV